MITKTAKRTRAASPGVPWRDYLDEQLKDPEFRAEYEALEPEFALIRQLIDLRIKRGLSQRQLAKRAEMQQPTIARLEGGRTASLKTLQRVAEALEARVEVRLVPREAAPSARGETANAPPVAANALPVAANAPPVATSGKPTRPKRT
jgi:transcriptional regulator with XRE-family HTH domain